jgi:small multidrug resistance pump
VPWVWLTGAISLEVVATLNLKMSEGFTRFWPSVVVILGYIGSFSLLGATLKRIDVGTVYAIWSGAGTVVVVFVGIMLFDESAAMIRLLGIAVIMVGVIVVNLSGPSEGGLEAAAAATRASSDSGDGAGGSAAGAGSTGTAGASHPPAMRHGTRRRLIDEPSGRRREAPGVIPLPRSAPDTERRTSAGERRTSGKHVDHSRSSTMLAKFVRPR